MNQRSREKIALVVFAIAVVAFFVFTFAYLVYGHSWTNAAREIDETRGVMDDYTVILYEGTHTLEEVQEYERALQAKKEAEADAAKHADPSDAAAPSGETGDGTESPSSCEASSESDKERSANAAAGSSDADEQIEPVSIDDLKEVYRSKGARVVCLDSRNPASYEGDDIYLAGSRRIGVFYASAGITVSQMIDKVNFFAEHKTDLLVCMADSAAFVRNDSLGIDAVVPLGIDPDASNGTIDSGTLYSVMPLEGQVGAIIISPEGVISSKVIVHAQSVEELDDEAATEPETTESDS